jgi:hypothetical protein
VYSCRQYAKHTSVGKLLRTGDALDTKLCGWYYSGVFGSLRPSPYRTGVEAVSTIGVYTAVRILRRD